MSKNADFKPKHACKFRPLRFWLLSHQPQLAVKTNVHVVKSIHILLLLTFSKMERKLIKHLYSIHIYI